MYVYVYNKCVHFVLQSAAAAAAADDCDAPTVICIDLFMSYSYGSKVDAFLHVSRHERTDV